MEIFINQSNFHYLVLFLSFLPSDILVIIWQMRKNLRNIGQHEKNLLMILGKFLDSYGGHSCHIKVLKFIEYPAFSVRNEIFSGVLGTIFSLSFRLH